jgi:hypothetical protein
MMIQALGHYTPNQTRSVINKNESLQAGRISSTRPQASPQFGSDIGEGFGIAFKVLAVAGGVTVLGAVTAALGIGYWLGKSNTPQAPVQPAPTVQTDNTNPPTK